MSNEEKIRLLRQRSKDLQARLTANDDEVLPSVLQFFASSDDDKVQFIPPRLTGHIYTINESGDQSENPLLFYCHAAYEILSRDLNRNRDESHVISEMVGLLDIMFHCQASGMFECWSLDSKNNLGNIGATSNAQVWCVLRRLAKLALVERGWPLAFPQVPFIKS